MLRKKVSKSVIEAVPFAECPAKTAEEKDETGGSTVRLGKSVYEHGVDTGLVCKALLESMGECRRRLFPAGMELLCAVHDIGKISPAFIIKLLRQAGIDPAARYPQLAHFARKDIADSTVGYHSNVGAIALEALSGSKEAAEVVAQHHGSLRRRGLAYNADDEALGGNAWQLERRKLLDALARFFKCQLPVNLLPWQVAIMAGLTCTSDWIASGLSPGFSQSSPQCSYSPSPVAIKNYVRALGFKHYKVKKGLRFEDVFGFKARETQSTFIDAVTAPGVYVFEASMGYGKTEAAFYASYKMLESGQADGIYFALPTQLTSEKIHERLQSFLDQVIAVDGNETAAPLLLHSKAWLNETLRSESSMGGEAAPGHSWFTPAKRGLLFPFAAGTVDQALTAVMNVRRSCVRAFGLCGKVIIIDEVHSYDIYTGTLVDALVELGEQLGCTILILSATLTAARRARLTGADTSDTGYPLISARRWGEKAIWESAPQSVPGCDVTVSVCQTTSDRCRGEAMRRALLGEQVLWIENTVRQAQESFEYFTEAARQSLVPIEIGLLHSRFTPHDRERNESRWLSLYGPGSTHRGESGRILVGTQVVEESVDLDADFLVSAFAPSDMLLQRAGRLWRHQDTVRPQCARREMWLIEPEHRENGCICFGSSERVYEPYVLHRSYELWQTVCRTGKLKLPGDIRSIIEDTYSEREEADVILSGHKQKLLERKEKMLAQINYVRSAGATVTLDDKEGQCATRYIQHGTVTCLIVKDFRPGEHETQIVLCDGSELILKAHGQESADEDTQVIRKERVRTAAALLRHCVPCPAYVTADGRIRTVSYDEYKKWGLREYLFADFSKNDVSSKLIIMMYNQKDGLARAQTAHKPETDKGTRLEYDSRMGLRFTRGVDEDNERQF